MSELEMVIEWIASSKYAVALTGAGVSAESGIPTFRGRGGLWERFRPEELATPEAFALNPTKVWEWYKWRQEFVFSAKPGPTHIALAKLEEVGVIKCVITQNVDGLHQLAGSRNVIELHGSIRRVRCTKCAYRAALSSPVDVVPPRCPVCGSLLRPDVVWFGEQLPAEEWSRALEEASRCDLMLVLGTSGVVYPAAYLPYVAKSRGAKVVEVNVEETPLSHIADVSIRAPAGEVMSRVVERVLGYALEPTQRPSALQSNK